MEKKYLTTKEVAEILNKTIHTIYKYVREGTLSPISDHRWRMRQGNLFEPGEVYKLKDKLKKGGYTTTEAAKKLGVVPNTVYTYIQQGLIIAKKEEHRGRMINIITEEELNRFIEKSKSPTHDTSKEKSYYIKKEGYYLFQPFIQFGTNKKARITNLNSKTQDLHLLDEDKNVMIIQEARRKGYKPAIKLTSKPYSQKKGRAIFRFSFSEDITANVYTIIDILMQTAGYQNIYLDSDDSSINIEVKPSFIDLASIQSYLPILNNHLVEGELILRQNGIYIDSDYASISVDISKSTKKWIQDNIEKEGITQGELVRKLITEAIFYRENKDD